MVRVRLVTLEILLYLFQHNLAFVKKVTMGRYVTNKNQSTLLVSQVYQHLNPVHVGMGLQAVQSMAIQINFGEEIL